MVRKTLHHEILFRRPNVNKRIESAFFDAFGSKYGDYDVLGELAYRRLLTEFANRVQPKKNQRCIDLGCGTGAFTRRLTAFDLSLIGVDISPQCINLARQEGSRETYEVGDLMNLSFEDATADIVVYSGVLHHIAKSNERICALREGWRILKPGGRLFAYDPNKASPSMWLYRSPRSPFFSEVGKTENEVLLSRKSVLGELDQAGFIDITVQGLGGITFRFVESKLARTILPLYNLYEILMMLSPFQRTLGTFLISCASKPGS